MNKKFLLYTTLTAALCITGCTNVATFDYAEAPGPMVRLQEKGAGKKTIAVLPFMDQRGTKYFDPMQAGQAAAHPAGDHGSFYLGFLPLLPAGFVERTGKQRGFCLSGQIPFQSGTGFSQRRRSEPENIKPVRLRYESKQSGTGADGLSLARKSDQHLLQRKHVFLLHHLFSFTGSLDSRRAKRNV